MAGESTSGVFTHPWVTHVAHVWGLRVGIWHGARSGDLHGVSEWVCVVVMEEVVVKACVTASSWLAALDAMVPIVLKR